MRYTIEDVKAVGKHVESVTEGKLGKHASGTGYGGTGTRIVDMNEERVFIGSSAIRQALAHYMGMSLTLARETRTMMPEAFEKYRESMVGSGLVDGHPDFESGKERALSYLRRKQSDVS